MNENSAAIWFDVVHGDIDGWINLRAIDPDQKKAPQTFMVRTVEEALDWCRTHDNAGMNVYCGLARRGDITDEHGRVDASEANLGACQVLWADLDDGTREEQEAAIARFPIKPTLTVDSGGGLHAIWRVEDPIKHASDPESNLQLRRILKGIQVVIGGDPAVIDASRIFRVAGTMNYPNARKRANGRTARESSVFSRDPYTVVLEDFEMFEDRGAAEFNAGPREVHGHAERVPASVDMILNKNPRMRKVFYCEDRMNGKSPSDEDFAIATGLFKYAPWLKEEDVADALRYRRIALAHLVKGSDKASRYYAHTALSARERVVSASAPPPFSDSPARWFQHVLNQALIPRESPTVMQPTETDSPIPRISTGDAALDTALGGGVYGFTVIAGNSGVGKSTLALNVALNAVNSGWRVIYVAAEMEYADYLERTKKYIGSKFDADKRMPLLLEIGDGVQVDRIMDAVAGYPDDDTERYLIVIDSITKAATYSSDEDKPNSLFSALGKLIRLGEGAVRNGERRICVVMTSEMNKDGAALGRRITYSSSLQIDMNTVKEAPQNISIRIPKARYSSKFGEVGEYSQDWERHRFQNVSGGPFREPEPTQQQMESPYDDLDQ